MMKKITSFCLFIALSLSLHAHDNCSNATILCANNTIVSTTAGATASGSDPALSCGDNTINNSTWFSVLAINNGTATVTVTQINNNPGLEMEIYTGICGSLTTIGVCTSGVGPNGSMNVTFPTIAGTTYYILVDGTAGNQEAFSIQATTVDNAIIAKPDANFITDPDHGCVPLDVLLDSTTIMHGGTNITFQWRIDGGSFLPASGYDTTVTLSTTGTHTIDLRVCNAECGCKTNSQEVIVQYLSPSITVTAPSSCMNTPIDFDGNAQVLPDPPYVDPNVTIWFWDFGDPGSGANNFANGQSVSHTFVGPGTTFTVSLTTDGSCGPATTTTTITLNPEPVVTAGPDQQICEGNPATLTATLITGASPVQSYNWVGPGTINCSNCSTTTVDNLPAPGTYTFTLDIVDANGCTADTTVNVTVIPKPTVNAGSPQFTCPYQPVFLTATPLTGIPPFTFLWSPPTDLNNPTLQNPTARVNADVSYCVTMTDSLGCTSDAACMDIFVYPPPTISPSVTVICATNPNLTDTFTVSGAGAGSTYSWILSPDYSLINGANADSSSVYVTFPAGVSNTYNFTAVVTDGVTGCIDTVSTSFTVTNGLNMSITGPNEVCSGLSATLTASGAINYAWTASPAYPFADSTLASQTVSPVITTTFTVYGTAGSCSAIASHTLTVRAVPTATAAGIPDFCGCATVALNGLGSTPGMTYLWTSFGGAVIANPNALNTTSTICSGETFVLTVTDTSSGCSMSDTTTANELPNPVAAADVSPSLICPGTSTLINLDGTGSTVGGGITYLWTSNPVVVIANDTILSTTATVSTATTFSLTVTDAFGCDSTASDTVFIYPPPTISATPAFLCTADPLAQSTIDISGAAPGSTYSWDTIPPCVLPVSANTSSQAFDFTTCGTGSYNFFVTVTDASTGCVTTLSQTVTIIAGVNLVVSNDTTICEGSSVTLTASGANTFLWSTLDTTASITLPGLTAAGSPYQFIVTGRVGSCTGVDTIIVTVNPVPVTSPITGPASVCANDSGVVYSVTPIIGNYIWSVAGGSISSGQGTNSIQVNWGGTGIGNVSVYDSSAAGCTGATQILNVTINPLPVTSIIFGQDSVCENSTSVYFVLPHAGSTYNWNVTGGVISGSSTGPFINVIWGPAGSGSVSVTETNAVGCSGTMQTLAVVISPVPLTVPVVGNSNLCEGDTMQLYFVSGGAGSVYNWIVVGGAVVSGQGNDSVLVNWGTPGTGSVNVLETNSAGCTGDTSSLSVTVNTAPVATVFPDSANVCNNSPYPVAGSTNTGTIHWTTSGSGTFNDTTIASPLYTPGLSDTSYVTLTMVLSNPPCPDDTATIVLHFTVPPVVTITTTDTAICSGDNDTLTATGGGSYLWSSGQTTAMIVVSPPSSIMYTVTVSTGFGCNTMDSVFITVDSVPVITPIAGRDSVCENDIGVLYTVQPDVGNFVWTVTGGTIVSGQSSDSVFVNWNGPGTGTVSVFDTSAAGCASTIENLNVVISAIPTTTPVSGPDSVCENSSATYFITPSGGSTYNWTVVGGTITSSPTGSFISVTWGTAGAGFVSVTETNAAGCSDTAQTMNVVINPVPLLVLVQGNTNLCEGDSIQVYSTLATAGSTYNWNVNGGTLVSGQGTDSIVVNWGSAGIDTITVLETNLFGCTSDTAFYIVTLNQHPVASVSPDSGTVCQGSTFPLSGSVNIGTIQWLTSGTGTFDTATIASPVYSPGLIDTGYVLLTMILSNPPCPDDTEYVVVYVAPSPVVSISASQNIICYADSDTLSATGIGSYLWTPGGDTTSTIVVHPLITTTYYVTVTNIYNCSTSDSIIITVIPPGIPNAGADQIVCIDDTAQLNGTYQNAGGLQWSSLGDGIFLPDSISPSVIYVPGTNDSATGNVQIVVVTTGACLNLTDTMNLSIYQFPSALAGNDTLLTEGPISGATVPLNGIISNATGGVWTTSGNGTFSPDNTTLNAVYTPSVEDYDRDSVIITLLTTGGCRTATDYMVISFSPFNIPNVFTPYPTSPGMNDYFEIKNLPPGSGLKIWDRWGMLVFTTDYYRNDWDAAELKADTYYYSLTTDKKEYHGFITVIRGD